MQMDHKKIFSDFKDVCPGLVTVIRLKLKISWNLL